MPGDFSKVRDNDIKFDATFIRVITLRPLPTRARVYAIKSKSSAAKIAVS